MPKIINVIMLVFVLAALPCAAQDTDAKEYRLGTEKYYVVPIHGKTLHDGQELNLVWNKLEQKNKVHIVILDLDVMRDPNFKPDWAILNGDKKYTSAARKSMLSGNNGIDKKLINAF